MNNPRMFAASMIAGATLMLATVPGIAAGIDVNIGFPVIVSQPQPVYVQQRPVYIHPQYENDWRDRQLRAVEWRDNPKNHGHEERDAAHSRKHKQKKHHHKDKHDH